MPRLLDVLRFWEPLFTISIFNKQGLVKQIKIKYNEEKHLTNCILKINWNEVSSGERKFLAIFLIKLLFYILYM
jgi:hypothetical protein